MIWFLLLQILVLNIIAGLLGYLFHARRMLKLLRQLVDRKDVNVLSGVDVIGIINNEL